jgi:hypothetical protein
MHHDSEDLGKTPDERLKAPALAGWFHGLRNSYDGSSPTTTGMIVPVTGGCWLTGPIDQPLRIGLPLLSLGKWWIYHLVMTNIAMENQ